MERLTNKREADAQREEYERRLANGYPQNIPEERFLRLAAYEDTGLEPAVCANYKTFEDEAISKGVTFKRIVALMEAYRDGRLVVLPCKVGDTVWRIKRTFETYPDKSEPYIEPDAFLLQDVFNIGKTVFLTREEAYHELKRAKGW